MAPEMPGDARAGRLPLVAMYQTQDAKYGRRVFRPGRLAIACVLLVLAAIFGPWVGPPLPDPIAMVFAAYTPFVALLVMILTLLAAFRVEPGFARIAAVLGLLLVGFFFVGTALSALALGVLRKVETAEPRAAST